MLAGRHFFGNTPASSLPGGTWGPNTSLGSAASALGPPLKVTNLIMSLAEIQAQQMAPPALLLEPGRDRVFIYGGSSGMIFASLSLSLSLSLPHSYNAHSLDSSLVSSSGGLLTADSSARAFPYGEEAGFFCAVRQDRVPVLARAAFFLS
jgi:hypothetical protein